MCGLATPSARRSEYAYRLRLSAPRPDFELRWRRRACTRSLAVHTVAVYALRKDGFNGDIALRFKDDPVGLLLNGAVIPAGQDMPASLWPSRRCSPPSRSAWRGGRRDNRRQGGCP